jgi:hypothetical protein
MHMLKSFVVILTIALLSGCFHLSSDINAVAQPTDATINFTVEDFCGNEICLTLEVDCMGLNTREVDIRAHRNERAKGAVIFTTGGSGRGFYGGNILSADRPSGETVMFFREQGYETFELAWQGEFGWATDNYGAGLKAVMCAYAEVVEWIADIRASNPAVMGATGNSGGSMQIGYGLASHGLDEILDAVVLSGGPPTSDAWDVCFGSGQLPQPRGGTSVLMDHVLGFLGDGDYCQWGAGPEEAEETARRESIVSSEPGEVRDYDYPSTVVSFVEGGNDRSNIPRAQLYFDAIKSAKTWDLLPGVPHSVQNNPDGAAKIRERLFEHLEALIN